VIKNVEKKVLFLSFHHQHHLFSTFPSPHTFFIASFLLFFVVLSVCALTLQPVPPSLRVAPFAHHLITLNENA